MTSLTASQRGRAFATAFVVEFIVVAFAAFTVGNAVQDEYLPTITGEEGGARSLLFLTALAIHAATITYILPRLVEPDEPWLPQTLKAAVPLGASIFLATHLFQAGYTNLSVTGWILEGFYDSLGPIAAAVAVGYLIERTRQAAVPATA